MFKYNITPTGIEILPYAIIERNQYTTEPAIIKMESNEYTNKDRCFWCANDLIWKYTHAVRYSTCEFSKQTFEFDPCINIKAYKNLGTYISPKALRSDFDFTQIGKNYYQSVYFLNEENAANSGYIPHKYFNNLYADSEQTSVLRDMHFEQANVRIARNYLVYKYNPERNKLHDRITKSVNRHIVDKPNSLFQCIGDMLGNTFGLEMETSIFAGPFRKLLEYHIIPLKDGSLPDSGMEFCTPPLNGEGGIDIVSKAMQFLNKHSRINSSCSLHVHVDASKLSPKEICALYVLYLRIQDEVHSMFPAYINAQVSIARKAKEFSARLEPLGLPIKLKKGYNKENEFNIYKTITEAYTWDSSKEYDRVPWGENSWNCASRYSALNMVPYFTNKKTIEFRAHPPTLSYQTTIDWLAFIGAILNYARNNADFILNSYKDGQKITFYNVLQEVPNQNLSDRLIHVYEIYSEYRAIQYTKSVGRANEGGNGVQGRNEILMSLYNSEFDSTTGIIKQLHTKIYD